MRRTDGVHGDTGFVVSDDGDFIDGGEAAFHGAPIIAAISPGAKRRSFCSGPWAAHHSAVQPVGTVLRLDEFAGVVAKITGSSVEDELAVRRRRVAG